MDKIRVAHISLPFYNGGGLVRYVKDLVETQQKSSEIDYSCIFYTGDYNLIRRKPNIVKHVYKEIDLFKVNNFNPTTLLEGSLYPEKDINNEALENVIMNKILELKINTVHFHTFHGIPFNLVKKLKYYDIKVLYTAHDYLPLCNKITLIDEKYSLCDMHNRNCWKCNAYALNYKKLFMRYNYFSNLMKKNSKLKNRIKSAVILLRKNKKIDNDKTELEDRFINNNKLENDNYEYRLEKVREYFNNYVDQIIFSSNITKNIFLKHGVYGKSSSLLPVTNKRMSKILEDYEVTINTNKKVTFGYLGGSRPEKGYEILIKTFKSLKDREIDNWTLYLFGEGSENIDISESIRDNVIIKGYEENNIYDNFDVLIVSSICAETFNFVVLEGLYNKKLIVSSDIVGSADLYKDNGVLTYKYDNVDSFIKVVESILSYDNTYYINPVSNKYTNLLVFEKHSKLIEQAYMN